MAACEKSLDGSELVFRQPGDYATFPKHSLSMGVKSMGHGCRVYVRPQN